jgi:hypothetical protein
MGKVSPNHPIKHIDQREAEHILPSGIGLAHTLQRLEQPFVIVIDRLCADTMRSEPAGIDEGLERFVSNELEWFVSHAVFSLLWP